MKILAFDVGGTAIKTARVTAEGKMEGFTEHAYPASGREGVMRILRREAEKGDFDAIGISTAGLVDSEKGEIIFSSEAIPGYTGTPLKAWMEEEFRRPTSVMNDVNAAALGEAAYGAGKEYNDFLCLTYGTGIGGAIVIDKKIYGGKSGLAGEIGHIATHYGGRSCVCGGRGCYGEYASATALVRACREVSEEFHDGRAVFEAFYRGDTRVKAQIDDWIDEIVLGLVIAVHIFNPPALILGGGIMNEAYIVEQTERRLRQAVMPGYRDVVVRHAFLGSGAGILGAARNAMERIGL